MEIGIFEAKNRFAEVLRRVQGGEEVRITRRGKIVAVMMTPEESETKKAASTFREWRELVTTIKVGREEMIEWMKEGRR